MCVFWLAWFLIGWGFGWDFCLVGFVGCFLVVFPVIFMALRLESQKGNRSLSLKEEKLHRLITVELKERRGVEEIGLALLGGRLTFDHLAVATGRKSPELEPKSSSSRTVRAPEIWTLPDTTSPASSSSSFLRTEVRQR